MREIKGNKLKWKRNKKLGSDYNQIVLSFLNKVKCDYVRKYFKLVFKLILFI